MTNIQPTRSNRKEQKKSKQHFLLKLIGQQTAVFFKPKVQTYEDCHFWSVLPLAASYMYHLSNPCISLRPLPFCGKIWPTGEELVRPSRCLFHRVSVLRIDKVFGIVPLVARSSRS